RPQPSLFMILQDHGNGAGSEPRGDGALCGFGDIRHLSVIWSPGPAQTRAKGPPDAGNDGAASGIEDGRPAGGEQHSDAVDGKLRAAAQAAGVSVLGGGSGRGQ